MKIIWSPLAIDRVIEIASYIAQDDAIASEKWVCSLFEKVKRLEKFPDSGRVVPETRRKDIREIVFGNYRIIYRIEEAKVSILTVRHGKQVLPNNDIK